MPNDPLQPTTKRRFSTPSLDSALDHTHTHTTTHNHRNHSHQIRIQSFSTLLRLLPQLLIQALAPLISSSCVLSLLVHQIRESWRSTDLRPTQDYLKDFPALPQVFHDSPRLSLTTHIIEPKGLFLSSLSIQAARTFSPQDSSLLLSALCSECYLLRVLSESVTTTGHYWTHSPRNECHCCAPEF